MNKKWFLFVIAAVFLFASAALAQTTEFTYQGSLTNNQAKANGSYDFEFALYDAANGGSQTGAVFTVNNVAVANGAFAVKLDFGNQFNGASRFLEIRVRKTGDGGFTVLNPRQVITSAPYALKSLTAETAVNAAQLGGLSAGQYVTTSDARLSDNRAPLPGSYNYIQNGTVQTAANFNINGIGTANVFEALSQFNLGGSRVLSMAGGNNLFVGALSGWSNVNGYDNTFVGATAGYSNTYGNDNSFFGWAGGNNTTGSSNSFFGSQSGGINSTGNFNSFFGRAAGQQNQTGQENSFFGAFTGDSNTTGGLNSFFGKSAGTTNTTGTKNTLLGANSNVGLNNLSFATAVGAESVVMTSNTIQLGRASGADTVNIPGKVQLLALGGSGTTTLCRNSANEIAACLPAAFENSEQIKKQLETQGKQIEEQKEIIRQQQERLDRQQSEIEALKSFMCSQNRSAAFCMTKENNQ